MKTELSYENLKESMPEFVERAIKRAENVKNPHFDGSTDPSTWNWYVTFQDNLQDNQIANSILHGVAVKETSSVKKEKEIDMNKVHMFNEDFVKKYLDEGVILANVSLSMGSAAFQETISSDTGVPQELVKAYKSENHPPQEWSGKTVSVFKRSEHPTQPGVAKEGIVAVFERQDNSLIVISDSSNESPSVAVSYLNEEAKVLVKNAFVNKEDKSWDVAIGGTWNETGWKRLADTELEQRFGKAIFVESFDLESINKVASGMSINGILDVNTYKPAAYNNFDGDKIDDSIQQFEYGETLSDSDIINHKWNLYDNMYEHIKNAELFGPISSGPKNMPNLNKVIATGDTEGLKILINEFKENGYMEKAFTDAPESLMLSGLLWSAAQNANPEMLEILIDIGADPKYIGYRKISETKYLETSIFEGAILAENEKNINYLIDKGYFNADGMDNSGQTWLAIALSEANIKSAEVLFNKGADIDGKTFIGNTAFHIAASGCKAEAIEWLINKGARADIENGSGNYAAEMVPEGEEWSELFDFIEDYRISTEKKQPFSLPEDFVKRIMYADYDPAAEAAKQEAEKAAENPKTEQEKLEDFLNKMRVGSGSAPKPKGP